MHHLSIVMSWPFSLLVYLSRCSIDWSRWTINSSMIINPICWSFTRMFLVDGNWWRWVRRSFVVSSLWTLRRSSMFILEDSIDVEKDRLIGDEGNGIIIKWFDSGFEHSFASINFSRLNIFFAWMMILDWSMHGRIFSPRWEREMPRISPIIATSTRKRLFRVRWN